MQGFSASGLDGLALAVGSITRGADVVAIGAAASAAIVALIWIAALRASGGWCCLQKLRRGVVSDCRGRTWSDLTVVERGWFYGAGVFSGLAAILAVIGIGVMWG